TLRPLALLLAGCATMQSQPSPNAPAPAEASPGAPTVADYDVEALDFPPVRDPALPEIERVELPNGLVVYLTEDRSLPLVRASARIGMGDLWEPADHVGLAGITATTMRTGGAGTLDPDALNLALENLGASVEVSASDDATFASMTTLAEHVDEVLPLFAAVLMEPQFAEEKVALAKTQAKSAISRRNDNPQSIATRELFKLVYGPESPYARTTEYWTIDAISRDDVVGFYERYVHPNNTAIAVWGDFDAAAMADRLRAAFGAWARAEGFVRPEPPPVEAALGREIVSVEKDDVTQSTVLIGHVGEVTYDDPDYFPLVVMNEILGGGFSSRLFQTVRSDLGLAYAVFGVYTADYLTPGVFYSGTFTKSESTVEAARAMLDVIEGMQTQPPTDEELALAKDSYLNSFVFNFDTKGEVLNRQLTYAYYGYPEDFIQRVKAGVEAVTAEDVQRVAQQYLHPDQARILVLGNSEDFDEPVTALGEVRALDITIPTAPPGGEPTVPTGDADAGAALLGRVFDALGGAGRFAAIEAVRYEAETEATLGGQTVTLQSEATVVLPERVHAVQNTPMGAITIVLDGDQAVIETPGGRQPAPPPLVEQVRSQLWQDLPYLLARADELAVTALDSDEGVERLAIVAPGLAHPLTLGIDPETARPVRLNMVVVGAQGPQEIVIAFSDYQDVDGLLLPFATSQTADGEPAGSSRYRSIVLNPDVDPALFEME
ncbi:MAG: pitrilysin family protein, partial [Rubricoccaceae bacterium]|nr:pitrilysin family protein [Rubricoccaceae bacterium]